MLRRLTPDPQCIDRQRVKTMPSRLSHHRRTLALPKNTSSPGDGQRILATPYARRLARNANIDLHDLTGTGPRGRIKAADVNRAVSERLSAPSPTPRYA